MKKFLERYKLPNLTQKEKDNLNNVNHVKLPDENLGENVVTLG